MKIDRQVLLLLFVAVSAAAGCLSVSRQGAESGAAEEPGAEVGESKLAELEWADEVFRAFEERRLDPESANSLENGIEEARKAVGAVGRDRGIYGVDNRLDHHELDDDELVDSVSGYPDLDTEYWEELLDRWKKQADSVCLITYQVEGFERERRWLPPIGVEENGGIRAVRMTGKPTYINSDNKEFYHWTTGLKPKMTDLGRRKAQEVAVSPFFTGAGTLSPAPDERFAAQKMAGFATGFLVAPDIIVTAGHAAPDYRRLNNVAFVFGYKASADGNPPSGASSKAIYFPHPSGALLRPIVQEGFNYLGDVAVIRLDRPVDPSIAKPLELDPSDQELHTPVGVWGHPSGLPLKSTFGPGCVIVGSHWERRWDRYAEQYEGEPQYVGYVSNLDTYRGNSGSPVFNMDTGKVIGVLVGGGSDYFKDGESNFRSVALKDRFASKSGVNEYILSARHVVPLVEQAMNSSQ